MYKKDTKRVLNLGVSARASHKNLQLVCFDNKWQEIYLGILSKQSFFAVCPNSDREEIKLDTSPIKIHHDKMKITCAKWCPLDKCTILVMGTDKGILMYEWNGSKLHYEFNFEDNGIGHDPTKQPNGPMVKGIAALGSNYIAVGTHTGTILLFRVTTGVSNIVVVTVDSQRCHASSVTEMSSTHVCINDSDENVLASGDENSVINLWYLKGNSMKIAKAINDIQDNTPVTSLSMWNRIDNGVLISGYGSGKLRIFSLANGVIKAEIDAHLMGITAMDLAPHSGILITTAEDSFIRVWQLSNKENLVEHRHNEVVDTLVTGVKFLDPIGSTFATSSYNRSNIQFYAM